MWTGKIGPASRMLGALLALGAIVLATSVGRAQGWLTIKGAMVVPVGTVQASSAELVASNGERMDIVLDRNGTFRVSVPDDDLYTLRFLTPGCVTKEIAVDARNATVGMGRSERVIRFEVALHNDQDMVAERYNGAVGRMSFDRDGRMTVQHSYELVRLNQLFADGTLDNRQATEE